MQWVFYQCAYYRLFKISAGPSSATVVVVAAAAAAADDDGYGVEDTTKHMLQEACNLSTIIFYLQTVQSSSSSVSIVAGVFLIYGDATVLWTVKLEAMKRTVVGKS